MYSEHVPRTYIIMNGLIDEMIRLNYVGPFNVVYEYRSKPKDINGDSKPSDVLRFIFIFLFKRLNSNIKAV